MLTTISNNEGKYQESIQSINTPDPGHHIGKVTKTQVNNRHKNSQGASTFPEDDHKAAARNRQDRHETQIKKGSTKEVPLWNGH